MESKYPVVIDPAKVGTYPALAHSGGGFFYDEVLEYRVWVHPEQGDDYFHVFAWHEEAATFSSVTRGAEKPLALVLQRGWILEPEPNRFEVGRGERVTEWRGEWLKENKRQHDSIRNFLEKENSRRFQPIAQTSCSGQKEVFATGEASKR